MDPRHPELVIDKVNELKKRYDELFKKLDTVTTNKQVSDIETEGVRITRDISLYATRLIDALLQKTRKVRGELGKRVAEQQEAMLTKILEKSEDEEQETCSKMELVQEMVEEDKQINEELKEIFGTEPLSKEEVLELIKEDVNETAESVDIKTEYVNEPVGETNKLTSETIEESSEVPTVKEDLTVEKEKPTKKKLTTAEKRKIFGLPPLEEAEKELGSGNNKR